MKLYLFLLLVLSSLLFSQDDNLFITDYEYGQMLYKNPRGIGCIKCHGKDGQRAFISRYIHKGKEYEIYAPTIENLTLVQFTKKLKSGANTKSIMPTYFLTDDEIKSIYNYITNRKHL
jgi:cytochrome c553